MMGVRIARLATGYTRRRSPTLRVEGVHYQLINLTMADDGTVVF